MLSIFSAFYDAWTHHRDQEVSITLGDDLNQELFSQYHEVVHNEKKVIAIEKLIKNHLGENTYLDISQALLSNDLRKADMVFRVLQSARALKNSRKIMEHLSNDAVAKVFELSRQVANEAHLFQGFVRFHELENGILYSEISPKNQVLTCIADYFCNRFPMEDWIIMDKTHHMSLIHPRGQKWFLVAHDDNVFPRPSSLDSEDVFEQLWKDFFSAISIKERENYRLQRGNLPLRYRKHMLEFNE